MNVNINIVTTQFNELGEENVIKSNVDGTLYQKKDHKYIIYKEIENNEETTTSLKIEEEQITTQQGAFVIENHTKELEIVEGNDISIYIDYDIKIMDMFTGRNIIKIDIKEK